MRGKKQKSPRRFKNAARQGPRPTLVAVSGGFDPVHVGHLRLFQEAKKLGDRLVVVLNNDNWLKKKKGFIFMPEKERKELLEGFACVDEVFLTTHKPDGQGPREMSVARYLKEIKPDIFANGGDRDEKNATDPNSSLYWDIQACKQSGIRMVFNVGRGGKVQSSSWLLANFAKASALQKSSRPLQVS